MTVQTRAPEMTPEVGQLVLVRSRRWLVEEVVKNGKGSPLIRLSCADDDAQGQSLDVYWDYEIDRLILEEEGWADLASKGFDPPRHFPGSEGGLEKIGASHWQESLGLEGTQVGVHNYLAELMRNQLGDPDKAKFHLRRAAELNPDNL